MADSSHIKSLPILVIDRFGEIGNELANMFSTVRQVVFVSEKIKAQAKNILHVSFTRRLPQIPDFAYEVIYLFIVGGEYDIEILPSIVTKAEKDGGKVIVVIQKNETLDKLIKKINIHKNVSSVVVGDVFGKYVSLNHENIFHRFLKQAATTGRILIPNDGLMSLYPVFIGDVTKALLDLATRKTHEKLYFLFPKHPPTALSVARTLQKIDPFLKMDFVKEKRKREITESSTRGLYLMPETYPLKQRIEDANVLTTIPIRTTPRAYAKKNRFPFFSLLIIFFFLLFPILITLLSSFLGGIFLKSSVENLQNGSFTRAKEKISFAKTFFTIAQNSGEIAAIELSVIGKQDLAGTMLDAISLARESSFVSSSFINGFQNLQQAVIGTSKNPKEDFYNGINDIKETVEFYKQKETENSDLFSFFPLIQDEFKKTKKLQDLFMATKDFLPSLFGFDAKKTYLVLLQNNMELRPGGGFIGSYGLLTLDQGKLSSFSVHDVYDADGHLTGHVEPPFAIRRHLPVVHLFLRDSNFSPDFSKSASMAAYMLSQETEIIVDGVIGIDTTFVKELIRPFGSIRVVDYGETITPENFYEVTQRNVEKDFFPGSRQKQTFLTSLTRSLQDNLVSGKRVSLRVLAEVISDAITRKHLLFAFSDPSVQKIFSVNGFSGAIIDEREETSGTINDYLGISEANIGANKSNYFLKRKIEQHVTLDADGKTTSNIIIRYKNTSNEWQGGDYKNYLRFIVPQGASLKSVLIDGQEQKIIPAVTDPQLYEAAKFTAPRGLEVESSSESGKDILGILVQVPAGELKVVSISIEHAKVLSAELPSIIYSNKVLKQPGTEEDPYVFSFTYPSLYAVVSSSIPVLKKEQSVHMDESLVFDKEFSIQLTKN